METIRAIPENVEKTINDPSGVIYLFPAKNGKPALKAYKGKSGKPYSNYYYLRTEDRENALYEILKSWRESREQKENRAKERRDFRHDLKIGDIFHYSWGYDQTNANFFEVVGVPSDKSILIREIGYKIKQTGDMSGNAVPTPGKYLERSQFVKDNKPALKRVQKSGESVYITIRSFGWCDLWTGDPVYVSWYH